MPPISTSTHDVCPGDKSAGTILLLYCVATQWGLSCKLRWRQNRRTYIRLFSLRRRIRLTVEGFHRLAAFFRDGADQLFYRPEAGVQQLPLPSAAAEKNASFLIDEYLLIEKPEGFEADLVFIEASPCRRAQRSAQAFGLFAAEKEREAAGAFIGFDCIDGNRRGNFGSERHIKDSHVGKVRRRSARGAAARHLKQHCEAKKT